MVTPLINLSALADQPIFLRMAQRFCQVGPEECLEDPAVVGNLQVQKLVGYDLSERTQAL